MKRTTRNRGEQVNTRERKGKEDERGRWWPQPMPEKASDHPLDDTTYVDKINEDGVIVEVVRASIDKDRGVVMLVWGMWVGEFDDQFTPTGRVEAIHFAEHPEAKACYHRIWGWQIKELLALIN